jgi:peptidoglycan/LPS O-acetylase OafA/YrhL
LDGLRGIGLIGIILIHFRDLYYDRPGAPNWLLLHIDAFKFGLEMFFVLSGALITALLVTEHNRRGSVSLRMFYVRRWRRLGPTLVVLLPVLAILVLVAGSSFAVHPLGDNSLLAGFAVLFFVGNWVLAANFGGLGWLTPAWSLGVEEQFYLTWPFVLRRWLRDGVSRRRIFAALAGVTLLCLAISQILSIRYGWKHTHYVTTTHFPSILVGCALGYEITTNPRGVLARVLESRVVCFVGLVAMGAAAVTLAPHNDALDRYGYFVFSLVMAIVIGHCFVVGEKGSIFSRALGWSPIAIIGQASYIAYLVHIPVFFVVDRVVPGASPNQQLLLDTVGIVVITTLIYRYFERPIRTVGWRQYFHLGARVPEAHSPYEQTGPPEVQQPVVEAQTPLPAARTATKDASPGIDTEIW